MAYLDYEGLGYFKEKLDEKYDNKIDAVYVVDNASGDIATFPDGADNIPVKNLTVNVEPAQDLHGYANPWPAGGGKNKFGIELIENNDFTLNSGWYRSNVPVVAAGTYTWTGIAFTSSVANLSVRLVDETTTLYLVNAGAIISTGNDYNFTSDAYIEINYTKSGFLSAVSAFKGQLELGSTATSWVPYSNICPITGHTEANVTRTGFNLWDEEWELATINWSTYIFEPSSSGGRLASKNYIRVEPNTTYYVRYDRANTILCGYQDNNGNGGVGITVGLDNLFVVPSNCHYIKFGCATSTYGTTYKNDICINISDTAKNGTYEPYKGTTIPISFPSSAGTVYGGTLDVTSGKLTIDTGYKTFNGSETWTDYPSYQGYYAIISNMKSGTRHDGVSNMLANSKSVDAGQKNAMWLGVASNYIFALGVYESMGSTVADFKNYLSTHNLEVTYPLATPIEYTLTPEQLTTLLGTNNIWNDVGSTSVDYRADTKLYIDNAITQAIANALNA